MPSNRSAKPTSIVLSGPTASGKSHLALKLAESFGGEIVNADSVQMYRPLRRLSARPSWVYTMRVRHHLYGVLPLGESCSAADWLGQVRAISLDICDRNKIPIIVGGPSLYLKTFFSGIVPLPPMNEAIRAAGRKLGQDRAALYADLQDKDPVMAARLHPNDVQRLIRAWEVFTATGISLDDWQRRYRWQFQDRMGSGSFFICLQPPRDALALACRQRLEAMLDAGVLAEVSNLLEAAALPPDDPRIKTGYADDKAYRLPDVLAATPLAKAHGLRELAAYLHGDISLMEAIDQTCSMMQRYVRRQHAWLAKHFPTPAWSNDTIFNRSSLDRDLAVRLDAYLASRGIGHVLA